MGAATLGPAAALAAVTNRLTARLCSLTVDPPVTHTYNPLMYARQGYERYVNRYGNSVKTVILVGMNPGPFGMAQTGVPFGDVQMVRDWMGITAAVGQPAVVHPKRPVAGFACSRAEISGRRLWGWARARFGAPERFFKHFLVLNYCPLLFLEKSGRNRTPDKLARAERDRLFDACDRALRESVEIFQPQWVVGIGEFAAKRAMEALSGADRIVGRIAHPSPANPRANRGWVALIETELAALGIPLVGAHAEK